MRRLDRLPSASLVAELVKDADGRWAAYGRNSKPITQRQVATSFRFMTSSNLVGCSTGNSAGLAPLRILSTYVALRRSPDLEGHRKRLREALGNTLSDEFVDVILGKLVEALRPGLYDQLEEATRAGQQSGALPTLLARHGGCFRSSPRGRRQRWLAHSDDETRGRQFSAIITALIEIGPKDEIDDLRAATGATSDPQRAHLPDCGERSASRPADLVWRQGPFGGEHERVLRLARREAERAHSARSDGHVEAVSAREDETRSHPSRGAECQDSLAGSIFGRPGSVSSLRCIPCRRADR
jgi:hypothetical protein